MKRLKIVIAGTANPHINAYLNGLNRNIEDIEIVAISEFDDVRRAKINLGMTPVYKDYRLMLEKHPEAEAVMIGSDNIEHFSMFQYALEKKLHIYMMKVISMDESECREMIRLAGQTDCVTACELELRFNTQFQFAKQLVQSGKLGEIQSVFLTNISQSPCNYYPNWGDPVLSYGKKIPVHPGGHIYRGGAITDHPHPYDIIRWLTGAEFATVKAVSAENQRVHLAVEDHAALTGRLTNGIPWFINPSYSNLEEKTNCRKLLWPKSLECNLKITGSKGYFSCDYFDRHIYIVGNHYTSPDRLIVDFANRMPPKNENTLLGSFVATVSGKRKAPETGLNESYQAVRVMNAAYDSIFQGKTIHLTQPECREGKNAI